MRSNAWDISRTNDPEVQKFFKAAPAACRRRPRSASHGAGMSLISIAKMALSDRKNMPFRKDGGLAVLFGNIARDGCIVKTAGVDDSILKFAGPAKVYESQDAAVTAILTGQVVEGDVVVIRYEGPKGGPGHAGNAVPDQLSEIERSGQGVRAC
jgi:dihydroxy-acid dehydratase